MDKDLRISRKAKPWYTGDVIMIVEGVKELKESI